MTIAGRTPRPPPYNTTHTPSLLGTLDDEIVVVVVGGGGVVVVGGVEVVAGVVVALPIPAPGARRLGGAADAPLVGRAGQRLPALLQEVHSRCLPEAHTPLGHSAPY